MNRQAGVTAGFLLLVLVGSLVAYRTAGAARQLEHARAWVGGPGRRRRIRRLGPLPVRITAASLNYFAAIWPALVFGIFISASVHAHTPAPVVAALRWYG